MSIEDFQIYTPAKAVKYLREERGIIYSVASLRNLRRRKQAHAEHTETSITLWTKAELDAIEPSKRTKRVKKSELAGDGKSDLGLRCSFTSGKLNRQERSRLDALIA
jgi:hypothetical protein